MGVTDLGLLEAERLDAARIPRLERFGVDALEARGGRDAQGLLGELDGGHDAEDE